MSKILAILLLSLGMTQLGAMNQRDDDDNRSNSSGGTSQVSSASLIETFAPYFEVKDTVRYEWNCEQIQMYKVFLSIAVKALDEKNQKNFEPAFRLLYNMTKDLNEKNKEKEDIRPVA